MNTMDECNGYDVSITRGASLIMIGLSTVLLAIGMEIHYWFYGQTVLRFDSEGLNGFIFGCFATAFAIRGCFVLKVLGTKEYGCSGIAILDNCFFLVTIASATLINNHPKHFMFVYYLIIAGITYNLIRVTAYHAKILLRTMKVG